MTDRADRDGSRFDPARFAPLLARHGHGALLGLRYLSHDADGVALQLPYHASLVAGPDGALAGGALVALLDVAISLAVWADTGTFVPLATLDLRIDHHRASSAGRDVIGIGRCRRRTPRIAFVDGVAHCGDPADPVATVTGTFMFTAAA